MKVITGICLALMIAGLLVGWSVIGGVFGSAMGLILAICLAIPLYSLTSIFTRSAAARAAHPLEDPPTMARLDPSQLARAAYDRLSEG